MASETVKVIAAIEMEYSATAAGSLAVLGDLPGNAMAARGAAISVPASPTRRTLRVRHVMPTHLLQLSYTSPGVTRLYQVRIWARELPKGAWGWYSVYVVDTPDAFTAVPLPIPATSQEWAA